MLVSVTLVLLLMTMFASIFQIATGSMSKQRGISENDQRARTLFNVTTRDFQRRTFRYPLAYYPTEDSATSPTSFSNRSGYLYISTNDPNSGLDDMFQLTVNANILTEDADATPFFGRSAELADRRIPGRVQTGLAISPNQPEADDGSLSPNSVSSSPVAEICYFVRRGNLYRRVVLVREPLSVAGQNLGPQPTARSTYNYFSGQPNPANVATYDGLFAVNNTVFIPDGAGAPPFSSEPTLTNDFHLLFDHSAYMTMTGANPSARFVGVGALSNELTGAGPEALANPARRFGFNPFTKRSREHTVNNGAGYGPPVFMGRFTQAETSTTNFNYPQNTSREELLLPAYNTADSNGLVAVDLNFDGTIDATSTNGNPLDVVATPLALNPGNGVVSSFDGTHHSLGIEGRGGERRVEDLLLANVHEMKVEIWDQRLQRFVTPGHTSGNPATGELGDYHVLRCHNPLAGPMPGVNNGAVFDTWHPTEAAFDSDGGGGALTVPERSAPYLAYQYYPPKLTPANAADPPGPSPSTMPEPSTENAANRGYWHESTTYAAGEVVFARLATDGTYLGWDINNDGLFDWTSDAAAIPPQAFQIAYRMVAGNDLNSSGTFESGPTPPTFPTTPGQRLTDGEITWESIDNRRPLQSIRITFRFYDKTSDGMRQLSLIIPLNEVPL